MSGILQLSWFSSDSEGKARMSWSGREDCSARRVEYMASRSAVGGPGSVVQWRKTMQGV